jgi:hypothetical protein
MLELRWGLNRARVWLDELPAWQTPNTDVAVRHLPAPPSEIAETRRAAVEMTLPGPKSRYAALGATFEPSDTGRLVLRVPHSATLGPVVPDALAARVDVVHAGLASEYVPAIAEDDVAALAAVAPGSGVLTFDCAAHSEVGSSLHDFGILAHVVIRLLAQIPTSEEVILQLLQSEIDRARAALQPMSSYQF